MAEPEWILMPPLAALRAFEATARLGGFTAAGRALNVTHAAVAQQVRALEAHLGLSLAVRDGRSLRLTADGERLATQLTTSFGDIRTLIDAMRAGGDDRPVTITLTPTFASSWLMPRLGRLWAAHPDIAVSLRPEPRVLDLVRERIDFGIRFGRGTWPGVEARFLTSARYVIVGAPALFSDATPPGAEAMAVLPWVLEPDWPEQRHWLLTTLGLDPEALRITEFATEDLALQAARQGYGLHVSSLALVEEDIRAERLRLVFQSDDPNPGYYIVTPPGPLRKPARTVLRWLTENAG
ncbi:MAG: LysR family transcriptional regulator [Rhodobacteraceae bacterium]|nr:LysR family transcriptional regulator [Paracoccaceae bacterium]